MPTIVLHHHERFDGSGYPLGLKGEDIHLYGRILFAGRCVRRAEFRSSVPEGTGAFCGAESDERGNDVSLSKGYVRKVCHAFFVKERAVLRVLRPAASDVSGGAGLLFEAAAGQQKPQGRFGVHDRTVFQELAGPGEARRQHRDKFVFVGVSGRTPDPRPEKNA
jgi:hypothetical protein